MEPTKDQFEQHVRGLYEGLVVPAPSSTKGALFNALDQKRSTTYSGVAMLVSASLLAVGAWFISSEGQHEQPIQEQSIVVDDTSEDIVEEHAIETVSVVVEEVTEEVIPEVIEETTTHEPTPLEVSTEEVVEEEVDAPIDNVEVDDESVEVVADDLKDDGFKEVAEPFEVTTTESTETVKEERKEKVEWVLPASIKVEK